MSRRRRRSPAVRAAAGALHAGETAVLASQVIAARTALGQEALSAPTFAHAVEATTMVAEKAQAFAEGALAATPSAARLGGAAVGHATREGAAAVSAAASMMRAPHTAPLVGASYALAASQRFWSAWGSMAGLALTAHDAATAPAARAVRANARRLKRG